MANVIRAKEEADLIRKVRLIDSTLSTLESHSTAIADNVNRMARCVEQLNEQLIVMNRYLEAIVGDNLED